MDMEEIIKSKNNLCSKEAVWAIIATSIFLLVCIFGEGMGGSFGSNPSCYKYLGCTTGFFGYDAIEHFLFGIAAVGILVWFFMKFPKYSLLHTERWKNILTVVALIILVSVIWEFIECAHDYFRIEVLHQLLINFRLHINSLDQPTNLDTMGDLFFSLFGSLTGLFFTKFS
jgi:hypothetical protein